MKFKLLGVQITVSFYFVALLIVLMALDSSRLILSALVAALLHEAGHFAVMLCCKQLPQSLSLYPFGMKIVKPNNSVLSYQKEILIYLGGPLTNLACFFLLSLLPGSAASPSAAAHLALCLFNLLPIGALDGGMIAEAILHRFLSEKAANISSIVLSALCIVPVGLLAVWMVLQEHGNFSLLLTVLYLAVLLVCKQRT